MTHSLQGRISINSKGVGFVSTQTEPKAPKNKAEDILIESSNVGCALHGDTVEIKILPIKKYGRTTGSVVKIVERNRTMFVGTIEVSGSLITITPDNQKIQTKFIPKNYGNVGRPSSGTKVRFIMDEWKEPSTPPTCTITDIIGQKGEHNAEVVSILFDKGFDNDFPPDVLSEAHIQESNAFPVDKDEIARRRDFRGITTCTIDPVDAKDFDDALSIRRLENGHIEVGVHIADVSHYVTVGSALDKEASKRCFSVYLVDRTIPMLPEELSNGICSLNPHEDRLAFSAVFELDERGTVYTRWFGKTIIHSDKRFSYEEAQDVLSTGQGPLAADLKILNTIAKNLREEKLKNGAIDFDTQEIKFVLDEKGFPIKVIKKERLDTHKLVEEFMLLANREVAKFIHDKSVKGPQDKDGLMYRIHASPDATKINNLQEFLALLGHRLEIDADGNVSPRDINNLLASISGKPEETLIKTTVIRSMSKAIYATQNSGHYGLAFDYYTHFTSPIRRYPDLLVHRIVHAYLSGKNISQRDMAHFEASAETSTDREIAAAEAERESVKYKQVQFMEQFVGKEINAVISGVTEFGLFVEDVDTRAEGLIRTKTITSDIFEYNEKQYALIGQKSGKKYSLGDPVRVKVLKADVDTKTLDFALV